MQLPPFDKTRPFFPLVMNFAVQMIGFKETMAMADQLLIRFGRFPWPGRALRSVHAIINIR
jgi:hypothetical protein